MLFAVLIPNLYPLRRQFMESQATPSVPKGYTTSQFFFTLIFQIICYVLAALTTVLPLVEKDHPGLTWVHGLIAAVAIVSALISKVHYNGTRTDLYGALIQSLTALAPKPPVKLEMPSMIALANQPPFQFAPPTKEEVPSTPVGASGGPIPFEAGRSR